jgi:hypothetical protein
VAIRSPINPQTIVRERQATMPAAMNFISGGSPMGSSIVSSAANKIVGFQRGAAAVAPRPPDLGSIISTLSSNILNNVENRVQSINQNVSNIVNQTLRSFGKDYQDRVKQIDDAKPTGILANFLKLYQQAIEFVQFLGNRKNAKTLGDNLQVLQRIFTETFEVAKIIRQTIVKIVKQLSNLPTASTGGGGLNLDINVPGGPLRRSAPRGIMNMLKMVGAGAAVAGGGALAANAMSSVFGGGEEVQPVTGGGSEGLSGPILDRFSAILDRFDAAISSMTKKPPAAPSAPTGGGAPAEAPKASPGGAGGIGAGGGAAVVSSAPGDEKLAAFVASMEASSPENAADAMQVMLNRSASGKYGKGLSGVLSGYDQFSPISAAIFGKSADPAAAAKYGPIAAKLPGNTPQEKFQYLQKVAAEPDGLNKLQQIFGGGSAGVSGTILNDPKYLEMSRQNVKGALNFYGGKKQQASDLQVRPGGNIFYNFTGPIGKLGSQPITTTTPGVTPPKVTPSPTQAATAQQVSQTVAQPPPQQQSQVNVVPINLGSQQPQRPTSSGSPQPAQMSSGRQSPSMNASNDDNFLTLYSKMVYNIVDG